MMNALISSPLIQPMRKPPGTVRPRRPCRPHRTGHGNTRRQSLRVKSPPRRPSAARCAQRPAAGPDRSAPRPGPPSRREAQSRVCSQGVPAPLSRPFIKFIFCPSRPDERSILDSMRFRSTVFMAFAPCDTVSCAAGGHLRPTGNSGTPRPPPNPCNYWFYSYFLLRSPH